MALLFGLGVGAIGALAVGVLVTFGFPAIVAGLVGVGVTTLIGIGLNYTGIRPDLINDVSDAAGRY